MKQTRAPVLLLGAFIFGLTLTKTTAASAELACESLFKPDFMTKEAGLVSLRATDGGNRIAIARWLEESLTSIMEQPQLRESSHAVKLLALEADMKAAGLQRESIKVATGYNAPYEATMIYSKTAPRTGQRYVVRAVMTFLEINSKNPRRSDTLAIQDFQHELVGILKPGESIESHAAHVKAVKADFDRALRSQSGDSFPYNHPWLDHLRSVLTQLIYPLAMRDPSIISIGIDRLPNSKPRHYPILHVTRVPFYGETAAPQMLLPNRYLRDIAFDSVEVRLLEDMRDVKPNLQIYDRTSDWPSLTMKRTIYSVDRETRQMNRIDYDFILRISTTTPVAEAVFSSPAQP